jgi:hypothetical protein
MCEIPEGQIDRAYQKLTLVFPVVFIQASDQYCCGYLLDQFFLSHVFLKVMLSFKSLLKSLSTKIKKNV